ncbi:50S ribosomal protein L9 [Mycoplasma bradburyae]|uniref:Large ribosomal subunit protein bL9 n=1 Tax=Mycoplasma bradburyae TaxID=2963128 RepID=A0AAW6HMG5_9MOLU|nr:50S ribosomal protein L9 [Mycoplasma bradburyae]MDC4162983.1 50S ribosomal protein L9 [Mycoplasma bradburyae]MDC4181594.1 50S ribosomal protein L9 [Mycoplasma bradburyae]MDC4182320.1 50S ribosomal protein L9 [Mycoplasma bradburyae]MDC4183047.1 50S ribosomal protein L9 [Mycoplasma bradburyae]MDC4183765.1 50S ribosomal protein L9 [Mycoplasma bradburyae]
MKVILIKNVPNLGKADTVVNVSNGYAKNYLFKNNLAVPLTNESQKQLDLRNTKRSEDHDLLLLEAKNLKKQLEGVNLEYSVKTNQENKAFGTIGFKNIIDDLNKKHIPVTKDMLDTKMKLDIGEHKVNIKIFEQVHATILVKVSKA